MNPLKKSDFFQPVCDISSIYDIKTSQVVVVVKNPPADAGDSAGFIRSLGREDPWVGTIPGRRKWQLSPVFLPGEFHGQRSLAGYSPEGHKEPDMTETT